MYTMYIKEANRGREDYCWYHDKCMCVCMCVYRESEY